MGHKVTEGYIEYREYQTWYRIVGDSDEAGKLPILCLHGGPSEFHVIGTIKDWDVRHRLGEIHVPALITSGRYDEATTLIAETAHQAIAGSQWVLFENSSQGGRFIW